MLELKYILEIVLFVRTDERHKCTLGLFKVITISQDGIQYTLADDLRLESLFDGSVFNHRYVLIL